MLTSRDETDLILPLMTAAGGDAPFGMFLERLRRRVRAAWVGIVLRPGAGRDPVHFFDGPDLHRRAGELQLGRFGIAAPSAYDRLRPGRVYSGDEFDDHDPIAKARRIHDMRKLGLADVRLVCLFDEPPSAAWLIIASERACSAADSALLSNLAAYVAAAVHTFVANEQDKLADGIADRSLARAGCGWILFDKAARVLTLAPVTARLLSQAFGHPPAIGQRLRELGPTIDRALADAASAFADDAESCERAMVLTAAPRIEAILSPVGGHAADLLHAPAMLATCRQPRQQAPARAAHLANLFALPRREAELAILLADGRSLAEAGQAMGLTIETARNYSKRLFAKMGVRGQAELVRAVYESCATLA